MSLRELDEAASNVQDRLSRCSEFRRGDRQAADADSAEERVNDLLVHRAILVRASELLRLRD